LSKNRSFSGGISQRYALALLELSNETNKTEENVSTLSSFMKIYNSDDNLKNYIKNPTNTNQNQKEVFEKILNVINANKIIKNFFFILIMKKRIFFVGEIIEEFIRLVSSKKGEISANLFSSRKLDDRTISEIEKEISENIKGTIKLKSKVDESLIEGIVLQIGSLMIDTSIKNKLQKYKKLMIEA
jgi:F-type H+-transporting ATPase subunit delta|tara:strand:+ start:4846 stop:5403 length:558 start_codon:yes stop_codon:yes gene_type:complete